MAFDFNSLSSTPLSSKERTVQKGALSPQQTGGFDFNSLPKSPIELIANQTFAYGARTPEAFGLGATQTAPTAQWGIGINPQTPQTGNTAMTTPSVGQPTENKSYFEGLADTLNAITEQGAKSKEQYQQGEIGAVTKYSGDIANITSIAAAPIGELFNQTPVVGGIMKVVSEGLQYGPQGAGEALSNVPGYKQILEKNPWITDYSEAVSPTVENVTATALNLATLVGTLEAGVKTVAGGKEALKYRTKVDATGNKVTRDYAGDVVFIEDKGGNGIYGQKPANYPLIRLNSAIQDIKESTASRVNDKNVAKNATAIKEVITGTKSGQNWWANNPDAEAATQRVSTKVDLSSSVDTTGAVNTKPQQEYFKQTYLDKTESIGFDMLAKEDASVNLKQIENKLRQEFANTNLPQSIVERAVLTTLKKLITTADELGSIKLVEVAREKSAAQRDANYERTQNNTNNEIKNKTVGRALRLVVEETSKTEIGKVNGELAKLYQELAVLEKLDTMKVSGGKLGKYFAQISGNVAGGIAGAMVGGPVGAVASAVVGGELASSLRGRIMSNKFKPTTPKTETSAILEKAKSDLKKTTKVDLKKADPKVGAPKNVPKTKEIVKLESRIAKNVDAQRAAIKAQDFALVAKLKAVYQTLVNKLKDAIKAYKEMSPREKQGGYVNWGASAGKKLSKEEIGTLHDFVDYVDGFYRPEGKTLKALLNDAQDIASKAGLKTELKSNRALANEITRKYGEKKAGVEKVSNQFAGKELYHGTAKGNTFDSFDFSKAGTGNGNNAFHQGDVIYLTDSKKAGDYFSKQATRSAKLQDRNLSLEEATGGADVSGEIMSVSIKPTAKIKTLGKRPTKSEVEVLKKQGWDAVAFPEEAFNSKELAGTSVSGLKSNTIAVLNKDSIIWKKANRKASGDGK